MLRFSLFFTLMFPQLFSMLRCQLPWRDTVHVDTMSRFASILNITEHVAKCNNFEQIFSARLLFLVFPPHVHMVINQQSGPKKKKRHTRTLNTPAEVRAR